MRYCPHCGAKNPIGVRYCSSCGGDMLGMVGPSRPEDKSASGGIFGSSAFWLVIAFVIVLSFAMCFGSLMMGARPPMPTP